jgi:hypothetical protein
LIARHAITSHEEQKTMRYTVTLERGTDAGYMAWVHELPGGVARGATREEVESKIGPAIADFLAWARRMHAVAHLVEFAITRRS